MDIEKTRKAGKILADSVSYARTLVKPGAKLFDLAEAIETYIRKQGAQPAFPVNLSSNEIAAHATPSFNDVEQAHGLLKIDIGVHIDGWAVDTAFSVDLDNSAANKKLIDAAEKSLAAGLDKVQKGISTAELGYVIEKVVTEFDATVIRNLTGHSIEQWEVHAGISLPNHGGGAQNILEEGVYALEPFTTYGVGTVRDGKPSGIYHLTRAASVRDPFARKVLLYISETYRNLPFCSRWIYTQFGSRGLLALRMLEQSGGLYQYPQLIESSGAVVAQAEHTFVLSKNRVEVVTR